MINVSKSIDIWSVCLLAQIIFHVDLLTQLSLPVYILISIEIYLLKILVDLGLSHAVSKTVECIIGSHFILYGHLAVD